MADLWENDKRFKLPRGWDLAMLLVLAGGAALKMNYFLVRLSGNHRLYVNLFRTFNLGILLFGLGGLLLSLRGGRYVLALLSFLVTFIFFAFVYHFRYFGSIVTYADLGRAGNLPDVLDAVFGHIAHPGDMIFLTDPALLFLAAVACTVKKQRVPRLKLVPFALAILFAILLQFFQILGFNLGFHKNISQVKRSGNASFVNCYGISFYVLHDIIHHYQILARRDSIQLIRPELPGKSIEMDYTIPFQRKKANVILLQVESLDSTVLFRTEGGREITPNLNRLAREHTYAPRYFAQHNNGTVDADYSLLTSNHASSHYTAFTFCDMSHFTSLPRSLKKYGYSTTAMHANRATFYNRHRAFKELGFDQFYSKKDYPPPEEGEWLLDDRAFLEESARRILRLEQPFLAYVITVTSHTPFRYYPDVGMPLEFANVKPAILKNYFCSMHFVDAAIGRFMEMLKKRGILKNTILVIVSDHASKLHEKGYFFLDYSPVRVRPLSQYPEHVPLIFLFPQKGPKRIDKLCFAGDVAPTVMDCLALGSDPTPWMGHSLFSDAVSPVLKLGRDAVFLKEGYLFRGREGNYTAWLKTIWGGARAPELSGEYKDYISSVIRYSNNLVVKNYR